MYNLSKLNQDEINNVNCPKHHSKTEAVVKTFPTNKSPGQDGLSTEFYHSFKNLKSLCLKLFHKLETEGIYTNTFYKATHN